MSDRGFSPQRVSEVYVRDRYGVERIGTAYVINSHIALTARHVLTDIPLGLKKENANWVCILRQLGSHRWLNVHVAWQEDKDGLSDIALLAPESEEFSIAGSPEPLWGRLAGIDAVPCMAVGFPWAQGLPDRIRDTEQLLGKIAPLSSVKSRMLAINIETAAPTSRAGALSPWAGMSGAAVFAGPHLVGVLVVDPPRYGSDRLAASPISSVVSESSWIKLTGVGKDRLVAIRHQPYLAPLDRAPFMPPSSTRIFVARRAELESIRESIGTGSARIVGIYGMAGIGKTSLALHYAVTFRDTFSDGVLWARLDKSTAADALYAFMQAFGRGDEITRLPEQERRISLVHSFLASKDVLVILDNASSSVELDPLLQATSNCPVIVTTRHRDIAALQEAQLIELEPLSPVDAMTLLRTILENHTAVEDASNLELIATLSGYLPLALRIVASRAKISRIPLASLVRRLEQHRLDELKHGRESYKDNNVRKSFDLSYGDLAPTERWFFVALGAFAGSDFTARAAAFIAECETTTAERLLENLYALSLVQLGRPGRWNLHPLLRTYALEQATDDSIYERMAEYFSGLTASASPRLEASEDENWLDIVDLDLDNIRGALKWAIAEGTPELALKMVGSLYWYWLRRGYPQEGRQWIEQALNRNQGLIGGEPLARALFGLGFLAWGQGDLGVASTSHEESIALWRSLDDRRGLAYALTNLTMVAASLGEDEKVRSCGDESIAIWQELKDVDGLCYSLSWVGCGYEMLGEYDLASPLYAECIRQSRGVRKRRFHLIWSLIGMSNITTAAGRYAVAQALAQEALDLAHEVGERWALVWGLNAKGRAASCLRDNVTGHIALEESVSLARDMDDKWGLATALSFSGCIGLRMSDRDHTRTQFLEGLELAVTVGNRLAETICRIGLAVILANDEDWELAALLCGASEAGVNRLNQAISPFELSQYYATVATVRTNLDRSVFYAQAKRGRKLSSAEILDGLRT